MHVSPRSLAGAAAAAVLLLAVLPLSAVRADATKGGSQVTLTMTDGFVFQGMVRREGNWEVEEEGVQIFMPNGFFFIDDMARRQYFSAGLMQKIDPKAEVTEDKIHPKNNDIRIIHPRKIPGVRAVLSVGAWDDKWGRDVKFIGGDGREWTANQRLAVLTPYYAYTLTTDIWNWPAIYLTRELGPSAVRDLLSSHPEFQLDPKLDPADRINRHFRYCDFFAQAGWYDESEHELDRLLDEKPPDDVKAKVEAARAALNRMRLRERFETIKLQHNAGEYKIVRKALADFNDKGADPQTAAAVAAKRDEYAAGDKAMADASRFLEELPKRLSGGPRDAQLAEAAAAIRGELALDNLSRLEAFLGQARQAERERADGRTPSTGPEQLLSLAVTSWLGGLADPDPATAVKLWRARDFVQKYLASAPADRKARLKDYLSNTESAASVDDFIKIIPLLPPAEPETKISDDVMQRKAGSGRNGVSYLLQLPPEYRPSRNYPVLFVLHQAGEVPEDMIKRWRDAAADNGYILVAPEWNVGSGNYTFGEDEHATVLETLRDLRRHFSVDSDRVFLFGLGEGGVAAFDIGLSHPDLFAGVLPMSAAPEKFSEHYYPNGQFLPFFIVDGDRSGDINKNLRWQFTQWSSKYPMVWIQYKGRGVEWYGAEVPTMFDWMRGKRREFPLQEVGLGRPFATHRATDNSFYWLTTDGVENRYINSFAGWKNIEPATLVGRIDLVTNTVSLTTTGLNQVTVWLGRNGKNEPMVNFDKPLTVKWNWNTVLNKKTVAPSLETLLEDLANRGDRQRLFVAKLEFQGK